MMKMAGSSSTSGTARFGDPRLFCDSVVFNKQDFVLIYAKAEISSVSQSSPEATCTLWDYAVEVYSRPGMPELCLWFQDHCRVDVPIILFISWCSVRGVLVERQLLAQAEQMVSAWHRDVVAPLRGLRRELKRDSKGIVQETVCAFREKLKALELEAEHLELNALATLSSDETASAVPVSDQKRLIESGLVQYIGQLKCDIDAQTKEKIAAFITCLLAELTASG